MISALIQENRELHRQVDSLTRRSLEAVQGTTERALRALERRIQSSLDGRATAGRRSAARPVTTRTRRKVTDAELLERRRHALAKAREVRAAKRALSEQ